MGLINKLMGGAEGCREAMRDSYRQHVQAARQMRMDSPHVAGLFGAMASRRRARGQSVSEPLIWGEVAPFIAMEPGVSVIALAEYAAFQERHEGTKEAWLTNSINQALRSSNDPTAVANALLGLMNRVAWCDLLEPATVEAILAASDPEKEQVDHRSEPDVQRAALLPLNESTDTSLERWLRQHPVPQRAYEDRWRQYVLRLLLGLTEAKEPDPVQLQRDRIALMSVAENHPVGPGLASLRKAARAAERDWKRLANKYFGIVVD